MSIVYDDPSPAPPQRTHGLVEVIVLHARDAAAAADGGADRLLLLSDPDTVGTTPEARTLSAVKSETDLPVRVMLRPGRDAYDVGAEEFTRLLDQAANFRTLGAAGFSFGFLDQDTEIDRSTCAALAHEVGLPWSFHRGFDSALSVDRAWRDVAALPGLDGVASAGSMRGMAVGGEELIGRARADRDLARLVIASGGLVPEQVPWLVRAGIRAFSVGHSARADRSWTKAHVSIDRVRTWRMLVDDAVDRADGVPLE